MEYLEIDCFQKYFLNLGVSYTDNIAADFYYNICKLAKQLNITIELQDLN